MPNSKKRELPHHVTGGDLVAVALRNLRVRDGRDAAIEQAREMLHAVVAILHREIGVDALRVALRVAAANAARATRERTPAKKKPSAREKARKR